MSFPLVFPSEVAVPKYARRLNMLRRTRRAPNACSWCHHRKVRCDASILGSPCTRCRQDGRKECILRAKNPNPQQSVAYWKVLRDDLVLSCERLSDHNNQHTLHLPVINHQRRTTNLEAMEIPQTTVLHRSDQIR